MARYTFYARKTMHLSFYWNNKNCCLQESKRRLMNLASTAILIFISLKQCAYHVCVFTCYPRNPQLTRVGNGNAIVIMAYR